MNELTVEKMRRIVGRMTTLMKLKITIVIVPDDPNTTMDDVRDWVEVVVRGIGAVASIDIEPDEPETIDPLSGNIG